MYLSLLKHFDIEAHYYDHQLNFEANGWIRNGYKRDFISFIRLHIHTICKKRAEVKERSRASLGNAAKSAAAKY